MAISGQLLYQWEKLNSSIQEKLKLSETSALVFHSPSHALYECLMSLHLKFSHKRKIVAFLGQGDHGKMAQMEIAKLGVRFKDQFEDDLEKEKKMVLCTLSDGDNALTGEIFDSPDFLEKQKNMDLFMIKIFHHMWPKHLENIQEKEIRILRLSRNHTIALLGSKVSLNGLGASTLNWNCQDYAAIEEALNQRPKEDKKTIQDFETQFSQDNHWEKWFSDNTGRYFDRCFLKLKGLDGGAFISLFNEQQGSSELPLGSSQTLESLSFSRWQNQNWLDQGEQFGCTAQDIKESVIIPLSLIESDAELLPKMKEVALKLKELSQS